jgi:hypothetical protein
MKFKDTKYFGVKLSAHRIKNDKGQLIVTGCTFARTGKQKYHKSELDLVIQPGEDEFIYLDRPVEEVSSPATIASFEGAPITDDHPEDDVKVGVNWDYLSKGMAFNIKYIADTNTEGHLEADLILTDAKLIEDVETHRVNELSAGYNCDVDDTTWTQRKIRGNHIAVVMSARAGHMATIRDKKYSKKKTKDKMIKNNNPKKLLQEYLEWEGIYGYTTSIWDIATVEGYDALQEYLEWEGIYGYTDKIYDICTGKTKEFYMEDSKTVKVGDKIFTVADSYTYNIENQEGEIEHYTDIYAYNDEGVKEVVRTIRLVDNNHSNDLPSSIDNWLQDVAQITEEITYSDIKKVDDKALKDLKKLRSEWKELASFGEEEELQEIGKSVKKVIQESNSRLKNNK